MQKDLENFAKEMQRFDPDDRLYWLRSLIHCDELKSPGNWYKPWSKMQEDFQSFKCVLTRSLSAILTSGKKEEISVVKEGISAFISSSKKEKEEFCKVVQTAPHQKVEEKSNSSVRSPKCICRHVRRVKILAFDPSGRVRKYE